MPSDPPLVTVGIPTYNRAGQTLPAALESALAQDYPHVEIVVSDNCSSDNTPQLVASYSDRRVRYLRQKVNIGPTSNYKACLEAARGVYFLLLHDDDLIDGDLISIGMERAAHKATYGLIRTGTRMIDSEGKTIREESNSVGADTADELFRAWLTGETGFYLCSTIYNTEALRRIGGFHSKNNLFDDGVANIKIAARWPILNIPDVKASFRQHEEQRTHAAAALRWSEDFKQAIDLICARNPKDKETLYNLGMKRYAKVSLHFVRRIRNPLRRTAAMFAVAKHFPQKYWPDNSGKASLMGRLGTVFYHRHR